MVTRRSSEESSQPQSLAPFSSPRPSWQRVASEVAGGVVSLVLALGILSWLPTCLECIRLPHGGVSHDPWAWAPFVLDLSAAVAVAAPTSFGRLLDAVKILRGK